MTLLELLEAVVACARTEAEAVATVAYMVNAGKVRLAGRFRNLRVDLRAMAPRPSHPAPRPQRRRSSRCA